MTTREEREAANEQAMLEMDAREDRLNDWASREPGGSGDPEHEWTEVPSKLFSRMQQCTKCGNRRFQRFPFVGYWTYGSSLSCKERQMRKALK